MFASESRLTGTEEIKVLNVRLYLSFQNSLENLGELILIQLILIGRRLFKADSAAFLRIGIIFAAFQAREIYKL